MTVRALKLLKFKTRNGVIEIRPGQAFRPADPQKLIKAGLAIPVVDQVGNPFWQRPDGTCYACHGREAWLSVHGILICGRCHPPATPALVKEWKGTA